MKAKLQRAVSVRRRPFTQYRSGLHQRRAMLLALSLPLAALGGAGAAEAGITRIEITQVESPTFEGRTFGDVGAYEKLRGKAYGELDPNDPLNAVITDIHLAPLNADGKVEYVMDIFILKPMDLENGNHRLFMDVNNRGNLRIAALNNSPNTNNPTTADHAGEAFFMKRGYTVAANGWDPLAAPGNDRMTITVPVVTDGGATITGPSYEYISFNNGTTQSYGLAYAAATLDQSQANLTVKQFLNDPPQTIPASGWEYVDEDRIRLLPAGTPFENSSIYEFTYTAKDPLVLGIGLAATRDWVSFLRHATTDDDGNANPLAGDIEHALSFTVSQPARYLNDFRTLGFNEDEQGRTVMDGMLNYIGGNSGVGINYRFGQTARTERNRQNHFYPEGVFPFAFPVTHDSVSGKTGGRNERCTASDTCPKSMEVNSANEYWVKAGSMLHTDSEGNDLPDPDNARFYLISGAKHGVGNAANKGVCQQFDNPTDAYTSMRALFVDLDEWVSDDVAPPDSRVPRVSDGTAVFSVPQADTVTGIVPQDDLGFPDIPGVTYTGVITTRYLFDMGPEFDSHGIMSNQPPDFVGAPTYPSFVSRVDEDGNEIAGIRLPPVAVPTATTTGWGLRREGFALNDGCEASGQHIPFALTEAERLESGDPRLSLEERYGSHAQYVTEVGKAAKQLVNDRLMLQEDAEKYVQAAIESDFGLNGCNVAPRRGQGPMGLWLFLSLTCLCSLRRRQDG